MTDDNVAKAEALADYRAALAVLDHWLAAEWARTRREDICPQRQEQVLQRLHRRRQNLRPHHDEDIAAILAAARQEAGL